MPQLALPRSKRQARRHKRVFFCLLFCLAIVGLSYVMLFSPWVRIRNISLTGLPEPYRVNGDQIIRRQLTKPFALVVPGNHGWGVVWLRQAAVQEQFFQKYPEFLKITISYDLFSQTLTLKGELREPVAVINDHSGRNLWLDNQGMLFYPYSSTTPVSADLFRVVSEEEKELVPGQIIRESAVRFMDEFFDLSRETVSIVSYVLKPDYFAVGNIYAKTSGSGELILDEHTRPYVISQNLKVLLSQELQGKESRLEYLDLRFEDRAYYKLK